MKKLRPLGFLFGLLLCFGVFGQGETSNWYFGEGAGLKFNNDGSVNALLDGRLNTFEGCATISNSFGFLLFYTDGIIVYDRNHNIMQNGTGLYGDPSSTQSAIIVPKPEDPDIYYIFTVDTSVFEGDPDRGLNYSTVDMSLNNGNGAVVEKNSKLLADCSEKIAAVRKNCFDKSIWVITLASQDGTENVFNTYHAFEVNTAGVVNTSVKSTFADLQINDPRGALKFSPKGTQMASANMFFGLQLYDFDTDTGIFSNQRQLAINGTDQLPYGVEFSSKGQYLYTHSIQNLENETYLSLLVQYDLLSDDITQSQVELDRRSLYRGALQIGSNGKIYRTLANDYFNGIPYLGVIENPDNKGTAANYVHSAISLEGRIGTQGLPPFIQSFFDKVDLAVDNEGNSTNSLTVCEGVPFVLQAEPIAEATYNWSKDGTAFNNPDGPLLEITASEPIDAGRYQLEIVFDDPQRCPILGEASIQILPRPVNDVLALRQCDIDSDSSNGITTINLDELRKDNRLGYTFYTSILERENNNPILETSRYTNTTPFSQIVYYTVVNEEGCTSNGTVEIEISPTPFLENNTIYRYECDLDPNDNDLRAVFDLTSITSDELSGFQVSFYGNLDDASLEINPLPLSLETTTAVIYARAENNNQCEDIFELHLVVNPSPVVSLEESYLLCTNDPNLTITATEGFNTYQWSKTTYTTAIEIIGSRSEISISETGTYSLTVGYLYPTQSGEQICDFSVPFTVLPSNPARITNIVVKDLAEDNTIQVLTEGDGDYEYSLDGLQFQNESIFNTVAPGVYEVTVRDKNGCGLAVEKTAVIGYPKFFTPNGDGINDYWQLIGTDEDLSSNTSITIFDRYGKLLVNLNHSNPQWNGTFNSAQLPEDDYWFSANLDDGRKFKGHFSLKR